MHSGFQPKIKGRHQGQTGLLKAAATGLGDVVKELLARHADAHHHGRQEPGAAVFVKGYLWGERDTVIQLPAEV